MSRLPPTARSPLTGYAVAVGAVAAMVGLRWLLDPVLGTALPLVTLYGAVAAAVWAGGYRPAVLAGLLGYFACDYLFVAPRSRFHAENAAVLVGFLAYLLTCAIIIAFGEALRRARRHAQVDSGTLRVTLASMGDAVIATDRENRVTLVNRAAAELTGWSQDEALGRPIAEVLRLIDEQTRAPLESPTTRALRDGAVVGITNHTLLLSRSGGELPVDDSASPIRDPLGGVVGAVIVFREIGERRRLERERAERLQSARLLAAIVESSDDAIVSKSLAGVIQTWNRGAERLFGYTAAEAIGRHITLIIPPERRAEEDEIIARLRAGERVDHFDTVRVRRDGTPVEVSITISPIKDETGQVIGASKIARDIGDRKRIEAALREADRRKTEFLAILSHELRGPLAPLRNALGVMRCQELGSKVLEEACDMMQRQLDQMVRLVDDLFDVSRVTHDKIALRRQGVELASIIRHAVEASRPLVERAGQRLEVSLPETPVHLDADPARLAQVFGNLLNNASKFSPRGSRIALDAERRAGEVVVTVSDQGRGIPATELARIFDMFTQVEHGVGRAPGGLGVGLTLVKRLVELHGGMVTAQSEGPGKGSRFAVHLPTLAQPPAAAPQRAAAATATRRPRRFLVVDDNVDSAASLALLLSLRGHQAHTAHDGETALSLAEEHRPDVVLLDLGLPGLDGYEVCRRIRAASWGREALLVALTGWSQEEDRLKSKAAGFDHHLVKPVDYDGLMELLAG